MLKNIKDFWTHFKPTAIWSAWYLFVAYWLFRFLFNFNILKISSWTNLWSSYLHGLWGLAFGILLIAIPALYIATSFAVWNNKKMLVEWPGKKKEEKKEVDTKKEEEEKEKKPETPLPDELPEELRAPYLNMRQGSLAKGSISAISKPMVKPQEEPIIDNSNQDFKSMMPLPDDFSFGNDTPAVPKFKEINFCATPTSESNGNHNSPACKLNTHLKSQGYTTESEDDIIIARQNEKPVLALATHDDNDFWVGDDENWFANGKQKKSPIVSLKLIAKKHNATPILYLVEKNIMDLDDLIKTWTADGIKVIFAPNEV